MTKLWNRWTGRPQDSSQKSKKTKSQKRKSQRRRLTPETLESRQLLAANLFHNEIMPEDVNEDGVVSALDALTIINQMNRQSLDGNSINDATRNDQATSQRGPGRMTDVNNDGRDSALDALMVINRLSREQNRIDRPGDRPTEFPTDLPTDDPSTDETPSPTDETPSAETTEVRSIDGTGNNLENPDLGSADTPLLRVAENDYADGIFEPAGDDRPSAREISNTLSAADPEGTTNERNLTSFVFAWGQFLDHDIDLSLEPADEENEVSFDITVPLGDPLFDPFSTGEETISLTRSAIAEGTGTSTDNPAEQVNSITAWVDGSQVYGSDQETSDALREFVGGRLLLTDDGLLPTDDIGGVLAGDIRAAENVVLTSMQALFVREHNRLADEISAANPDLSDEDIFQAARATVIAEIQSITYNEYLPALLGEDALSQYTGYDSSVDPSIANEFSTAAFRFGHSTLNDEFRLVGNDGEDVAEPIALANAFFQPQILEETGIDSFLKYASSTLSQEIDLQVVDGLRNFLFGPPGAGGLDLVSLNIQRGRDHGLADYNSTRVAYGLDAVESFDQISSDPDVQANLESLYGDVDNIDLWVGLLAEDHTENGSLGETATTIISDQFERLRDGDRFWYENVLSDREIREIENTSLADVIERNTNINSLQENVFFFAPKVSGTVLTVQADSTFSSDALIASESSFVSDADVELLAADQTRTTSTRPDGASATRSTEPGPEQREQLEQRGPLLNGQSQPENRIPRDSSNGRPDQPVNQGERLAGVTVELLDSDGVVVATEITDDNGNYTFADFDQSGSYTVRLAATDAFIVAGRDSLDVQLASGDEQYRDMDFRVIV
ncbi:dockerin type I domain-containing protein [Rubripirellula amarantea]|nr:dockerin type I domain-containing protein [Rubripirellula amarantea]